ncbi:MAG: TipAS antibiotic-recognition domain-containing protein [Nocardioidaceae bacterium]
MNIGRSSGSSPEAVHRHAERRGHRAATHARRTAATICMAEFMATGMNVHDPAVQAEVDAAYRGRSASCGHRMPRHSRTWGRSMSSDPRFTSTYDKIAPGLAEYYRDAMAVYADTRLA